MWIFSDDFLSAALPFRRIYSPSKRVVRRINSPERWLVLAVLVLAFSVQAQENTWHISHSVSDSLLGHIYIKIDTVKGDTFKRIIKTGREVIYSKNGILLLDRQENTGYRPLKYTCFSNLDCYEIERYKNGIIKSHGQHYLKWKSGGWTYYHENGNLAKIENYERAYLEMFTRQQDGWPELSPIHLRKGPYSEYHQNGQLKVEGAFEIVEKYTTTDTVITLDIDTYEEIYNLTTGEFWKPKSIKIGKWNYYDENGKLLKQELYDHNKIFSDKNCRKIEARYWELMEEYSEFKAENKQKKE